MRTSSAANVGADKDSDKRQRVAIEAFAKRGGLEIVDWFYDPAVSGADCPAAMVTRRMWGRQGCTLFSAPLIACFNGSQ
jgi:hypothetical protein